MIGRSRVIDEKAAEKEDQKETITSDYCHSRQFD